MNSRGMITRADFTASVYADRHCRFCHGTGEKIFRWDAGSSTCLCVYRHAFRAVLSRYDQAGLEPKFKSAMFRADVELTARRALAARPELLALWQRHYLHREDYAHAARVLHLQHGLFFSRLYKLQEMIGRACLEAEICPTAWYFTSKRREVRPGKVPAPLQVLGKMTWLTPSPATAYARAA